MILKEDNKGRFFLSKPSFKRPDTSVVSESTKRPLGRIPKNFEQVYKELSEKGLSEISINDFLRQAYEDNAYKVLSDDKSRNEPVPIKVSKLDPGTLGELARDTVFISDDFFKGGKRRRKHWERLVQDVVGHELGHIETDKVDGWFEEDRRTLPAHFEINEPGADTFFRMINTPNVGEFRALVLSEARRSGKPFTTVENFIDTFKKDKERGKTYPEDSRIEYLLHLFDPRNPKHNKRMKEEVEKIFKILLGENKPQESIYTMRNIGRT